jgi:hypothetical protein
MFLKRTFTEESEKPPATNDPSCDMEEQFNLTKVIALLVILVSIDYSIKGISISHC